MCAKNQKATPESEFDSEEEYLNQRKKNMSIINKLAIKIRNKKYNKGGILEKHKNMLEKCENPEIISSSKEELDSIEQFEKFLVGKDSVFINCELLDISNERSVSILAGMVRKCIYKHKISFEEILGEDIKNTYDFLFNSFAPECFVDLLKIFYTSKKDKKRKEKSVLAKYILLIKKEDIVDYIIYPVFCILLDTNSDNGFSIIKEITDKKKQITGNIKALIVIIPCEMNYDKIGKICKFISAISRNTTAVPFTRPLISSKKPL